MPNARWHKLPEEKRLSLREAVLEEMAEHGFRNASVSQAMRRAGFSKGALYYYFLDKQDVFSTVIEGLMDRLATSPLAGVLATETPEAYWDALRERHLSTWRTLESRPRLHRIVRWALAEAGTPAGLPPELASLRGVVERQVGAVLDHGQQLGAVRTDVDDALLVESVVGLLFAADAWRSRQEGVQAEGATDQTLGLLKRMVAP